jgi:predicted site-specific integrase-resolvase
MAKNDKIRTYRTDRGQDRYDVNDYIAKRTGQTRTTVCYCRVSGKSQSDDLESQVEYMREKFREAEIIKD